MKTGKLIVIAALLAVAALALAACGGGEEAATPSPSPTAAGEAATPTPTPAAAFPLTIEQSDGVELRLEAAPQRIVSLSPHATEILCAIGAGDQLVAVDLFANCPLGSQEKPQLDSFQPNLEAIAGYQPDLVYVFSNQDNIVQALREIGIPVLYLELPDSLEGVLEQILLFGRLSGHEGEAQELVQSLRQRIEAVRQKVADVERGPRIFHELDPQGYYTVSPDTFVGRLYALLKAENIAAGAAEPYPQLSAEVIIQRDPQVIILADEPAGVTAESVSQRPGWDQISAVRNGRICSVDADIVSRPGPRIAEALETLARCLYPDRFP